jgi:hypothetical protein
VAVKITVFKLRSCVTLYIFTKLLGITIQKAVIFVGILVYVKIEPSLLQPACSHIMGCLRLFSCFSLFAKCTRCDICDYCRNLLVFSKRSKPHSSQTKDYQVIRMEGVRVWLCSGRMLPVRRIPGLDCY